MTMVHLRVVCPQDLLDRALAVLDRRTGVVAVTVAGESADGALLSADLARECADDVLTDLRELGVTRAGMLTQHCDRRTTRSPVSCARSSPRACAHAPARASHSIEA